MTAGCQTSAVWSLRFRRNFLLRWGATGGILLRAVPIYHRVYAPSQL